MDTNENGLQAAHKWLKCSDTLKAGTEPPNSKSNRSLKEKHIRRYERHCYGHNNGPSIWARPIDYNFQPVRLHVGNNSHIAIAAVPVLYH